MTCKTVPAYHAVFQKLIELVPQFTPESTMADFEDTSASAFRAVYGVMHVAGCWFHYGQAIVKRLNIGLKEAYIRQAHVSNLPLSTWSASTPTWRYWASTTRHQDHNHQWWWIQSAASAAGSICEAPVVGTQFCRSTATECMWLPFTHKRHIGELSCDSMSKNSSQSPEHICIPGASAEHNGRQHGWYAAWLLIVKQNWSK